MNYKELLKLSNITTIVTISYFKIIQEILGVSVTTYQCCCKTLLSPDISKQGIKFYKEDSGINRLL